MPLAAVSASVPDLLRLLAVPVFAWVAILDVRTRRVPSEVWIPLGALGVTLLVWDGWIAYTTGVFAWQSFLIPAALSLGIVVPLAYLFWWFGGFGGADAKALLVLAVLFPVLPTYAIGGWTMPVGAGNELLPFSLSILANGVLVALAIPVVLAVRNGLAGRFTAAMAIGWPVAASRLPETHGRLLMTTNGFALGGLDLDALRMYLRWRGCTLSELRADPERFRDPNSLPDEPNPPTDGAVEASSLVADGGEPRPNGSGGPVVTDGEAIVEPDAEYDDPWGAAAFLDSIEGSAYGTDPATLRDGLDVVVEADTVWISPGTPFLVPLFVGLLLALGYGDLLVTLVA